MTDLRRRKSSRPLEVYSKWSHQDRELAARWVGLGVGRDCGVRDTE